MRIDSVPQCQKDKLFLAELLTQERAKAHQPRDYKGVLVKKPWGHEFLFYQNSDVAAWFLHIKQEHATSMHCHQFKRTSLVLLSGTALSNTFSSRTHLRSLDAVIIESGVFHSTHSLSDDGIDLVEIETPPLKTDLVRLQDYYGRENVGYEGLKEMVPGIPGRDGFFVFDDLESSAQSYSSKNYCIKCHQAIQTFERMRSILAGGSDSLFVLCNAVSKSESDLSLSCPDVFVGQSLLASMPISGSLATEITLIEINRNGDPR